MTTEKKNARIEVFKVGTFTPMNGKPLHFSADTLKAIAEAYDPEIYKAPVVVGHPKTDDPAYGWIEGFEFSDEAKVLYADIGVAPSFADVVNDGHYRSVSMSYFAPDATSNPVGDVYYPKHVGFLGAVPPAVSGLKPVEFAAHDASDIVSFKAPISFGSFDAENVGTLFQMLREFILEKFGKEKADEVIPLWRIDWVRDLDLTTDEDEGGFAAPNNKQQSKEDDMSRTAEFAARQGELDAREAALVERQKDIDKREAEFRESENIAFAESLIADEKLIPANKDKVVQLLNAAETMGKGTVSFADGSKPVDFAEGIRDFLQSQPKIVSFGAIDMGEEPVDLANDAKALAKKAEQYQFEQAEKGITVTADKAVEAVLEGVAS